MTLHQLTFSAWLLLAMQSLTAQGLLDALNEGVEEPTVPVSATFKDTRIVNVQSNETPAEGVLHFVIAHRFGTLSSGIYDLWGLDNAQMRMALDYGITDRLAVGVARNTYQKTLEANVKARLLRQSTGPEAFPISVTWYSVAMANGLRVSEEDQPYPVSRRLSYVHQAVVARKMSEKLSLALVPSFVHRNFVEESNDAHDLFLMGVGGRYKLGPRFSVNGEYHHFLTQTFGDAFSPSLSSVWTLKPEVTCSSFTSRMHEACSSGRSSQNPPEVGPTETCILGST